MTPRNCMYVQYPEFVFQTVWFLYLIPLLFFMKLEIMNRKQSKKMLAFLQNQFGYRNELDYALLTSHKGKIYFVNKEIFDIDLSKLRIDTIGLYFGEIINNSQIRLSMDGCQMIGPYCTKGIVEIDEKQARRWILGEVLEYETQYNQFILIKYKNDYLGCGKANGKEIFNFVSKSRKIGFI
jgi:NOL1/NOP2/fmu family ribosome biogenesis protein